MELYLEKFIREHDNWEELLSAEPYFLKITRDDGYIIFKYNQIASDFNLPEVKEARGIIFKESTGKCVCHPFDKFGNYGEYYCPEIDWSSASVQQKIDGSLIKVWFDETWHISTNSTIDAFKANLDSLYIHSYGQLFVEELKHCGAIDSFDKLCDALDENFTYMFELITDLNRVVVPADNYDSSIYLLGARNIKTHKEIDLRGSSLSQVFCTPKIYKLTSLLEIQEAAKDLPWDEEGYVVCDKDFNRVKIKSPAYIRAHYARNNNVITWVRLIDVILAGEVDEFLIYAEEYTDQLMKVKNAMNDFKQYIINLINELNPNSFASRKDYALKVKEYPTYVQGLLFKYDRIDETFSALNSEKWENILIQRGIIETENTTK